MLIRHAKSSWEEPLEDFDRPLLPKGIQRAKKLSAELKKYLDLSPYTWYSSPANRAISTANIFNEGYSNSIETPQALYTFSTTSLQQKITELWSDKDHLVFFGHNPAFTLLVNQWGNHRLDNLPTSGIVHLEIKNETEFPIQGDTKLILTHKLLFNET